MLKISVIEGLKTATVRQPEDVAELREMMDIGGLEILPASDALHFPQPLTLPCLRILYVKGCRQNLVEMFDASLFQRLLFLVIADCEGTLKGLPDNTDGLLDNLIIRKQSLANVELDWIARQNKLRSLAITDSPIDDQFLASLSCRSGLRRLDIFRTNVNFQSEALREISFPALRSLDISETNVRRSEVVKMDELFPNLERLLARGVPLSVEEIREIAARWSKLIVLDTKNPSIDFDHHGDDFWDT